MTKDKLDQLTEDELMDGHSSPAGLTPRRGLFSWAWAAYKLGLVSSRTSAQLMVLLNQPASRLGGNIVPPNSSCPAKEDTQRGFFFGRTASYKHIRCGRPATKPPKARQPADDFALT